MTESVDERIQQIEIASWFAECHRFVDSLNTLEELWERAPVDLASATAAYLAVTEMYRICDEFEGRPSFPMSDHLQDTVIDLAIEQAVDGNFEGWDKFGIREDAVYEESIWSRLCVLGYADKDTPEYPNGWELNARGKAIFFPDGNPTEQFQALMTFEDGPPI